MKIIYITAFLLCTPSFLKGQCFNNLIVNGSFTDTIGINLAANGWSKIFTTDINDANNPLYTSGNCYEWIGTPIPSTDGGTWQNIFFREAIFQSISVIKSHKYNISFEYAAHGIECLSGNLKYDQPVGVNLYINDSLYFSTPFDSTQYSWEFYNFSFIAPDSLIKIKITTNTENYVGIDGFCLVDFFTSQDSIVEYSKEIYSNIIIPNIFTPNKDHLNNFFTAIAITNILSLKIQIFSRWGNLIFESDDLFFKWDGNNQNGKQVSEGTYYWKIDYIDTNGVNKQISGFVSLLR